MLAWQGLSITAFRLLHNNPCSLLPASVGLTSPLLRIVLPGLFSLATYLSMLGGGGEGGNNVSPHLQNTGSHPYGTPRWPNFSLTPDPSLFASV